jgi:hypothetical protein
MFTPDPTFFHPGSELSPSRIRIKEFKLFNPKKWLLGSRKYYPGCSSGIPDPDADFYLFQIPDPGVKKAPDPRSRIPDPDPQHCAPVLFVAAKKGRNTVKILLYLAGVYSMRATLYSRDVVGSPALLVLPPTIAGRLPRKFRKSLFNFAFPKPMKKSKTKKRSFVT